MSYYFYIILFIFAVSLIFSGFRIFRYIISAKKAHSDEIFVLIRRWHGQAEEGPEDAVLKETEKEIDGLFEKKIHKTSLLHFDEKFISEYFKAHNISFGGDDPVKEFERITRIGLKKSKQSLKILSLAFGHKFTLDNYPFYNYWLILRGNYIMWKTGKTDPEERSYSQADVDEPFRVLEYYSGKFN